MRAPSDRRSSVPSLAATTSRRDPRYGPNLPFKQMPPGSRPARSYLTAPVRSHAGELLGGLFFGHPDPGFFHERDERLIAGLAAHAAIAVDNAQLYREAQAARALAEAANGLKDEFLATLSHELRTPLDRHRRLGQAAPPRQALARRDDARRGHHHPQRRRAEPDHRRAARRVADHHRQAADRSAARRGRGHRERGDRHGDPGGEREGHKAPAAPEPGGQLRHGRSRAPAAGVLEPVLERRSSSRPRTAGFGWASSPSARTSRSSSTTTASASTPSSFPASSTASRRTTRRARGTRAASAWACPSRASWWSSTAAASSGEPRRRLRLHVHGEVSPFSGHRPPPPIPASTHRRTRPSAWTKGPTSPGYECWSWRTTTTHGGWSRRSSRPRAPP